MSGSWSSTGTRTCGPGWRAFLDTNYRRWHDAIAGLDSEALSAPLGPKGAHFADDPMAGLIVHINREVMHHGGEICLLRDLYRAGLSRRSDAG